LAIAPPAGSTNASDFFNGMFIARMLRS
jgi:hypothetical protein